MTDYLTFGLLVLVVILGMGLYSAHYRINQLADLQEHLAILLHRQVKISAAHERAANRWREQHETITDRRKDVE